MKHRSFRSFHEAKIFEDGDQSRTRDVRSMGNGYEIITTPIGSASALGMVPAKAVTVWFTSSRRGSKPYNIEVFYSAKLGSLEAAMEAAEAYIEADKAAGRT